MERGDVTDLVIMSDTGIDNLIKQGKLVAGSRVDLALGDRHRGARGRAEARHRLDRSAQDALLAANRSRIPPARAASISRACSSASELPTRQGQEQDPPTGNPVGESIARGEVEIGFQQISELLPMPASTISDRCRRTCSTSPCSRPAVPGRQGAGSGEGAGQVPSPRRPPPRHQEAPAWSRDRTPASERGRRTHCAN